MMHNISLLHLYYLDSAKQELVKKQMQPAGFDVYFSLQDIAPQNVDALLVGAHELTAETLSCFEKLQVIQVLGTNTSLIDLDYCQACNIQIFTGKEPRGHLIAEHAISLALALIRRLPQADTAVKNWKKNCDYPCVTATEITGYDNWPKIKPQSLFSSNVGILGAGAIALELIQRLQAFGCTINYNKRTPYSKSVDKKLGIHYQTFEDILTNSDVLFLQLPLNDSTRTLINKKNIALLKNNIIIINCGRAGVVDEEAFIAALESGHIGYAGLDVFWQEPQPAEHVICQSERVILTPHMAEVGGRDASLLRKEALNQLTYYFKSVR